MGFRSWIWIALTVLGCDEAVPTAATCDDPNCRQEAVLQAWAKGNRLGLASLEELPNEVERLAAISEIISRYPARVGPLCPQLRRGPTRERCRLAANRNHLHVQPSLALEWEWLPSKDSGRNWFTSSLFNPPATLKDVQADVGPCAGVPDATSCLLAAARDKVTTGTMTEVAALCKAVPLEADGSQQWRSECFFQVAETMMQSPSAGGYASAAELCSEAGLYLRHCHRHLAYELSSKAPVADADDPAAWAEVSKGVKLTLDYWGAGRAGAILVSETWSTAVELAVHGAETLSGDLIDQTPPDALPHLRASMAARLLSERNAQDKDLEAWAGEIERLLAVRVGRKGVTRHTESCRSRARSVASGRRAAGAECVSRPGVVRWPSKLAVDAGHPMVRYRGPRFRVRGDDAASDIRICLLEAAARLKPPAHHLLKEGSQHSTERVRWTAEALVAHMAG